MKTHFIAIGGSAMHNLAIALHLRGELVTGSDDEIFDPAKSRLEKYGLLPDAIGWFPEKIDKTIDAIILGMHARIDNPELQKAKELGIKIYSYPEYLYEASKDKLRIVVGGSHGKTTITSMIIHVLQHCGIHCDYMVGAQLEGFEVMVKLSKEAEIMVIEGDEYLTSPIDRRPKFHLYQPDIGIVSGIAWDHINVFPTFDNYVEQFQIFAEMIPKTGAFIYYQDDPIVRGIAEKIENVRKIPYTTHPYELSHGETFLYYHETKIPLQIFGKHNLANLNAAKYACLQTGVPDIDFYKAISSFKGASKRLELVAKGEKHVVYKDFAHSPSKLKATIEAVKERYPDKKLVACMELHTFSSLTEQFLTEYQGSMDLADVAIVFFDPHTLLHKKLPLLSSETIYQSFGNESIEVFHDPIKLTDRLLSLTEQESVFLFMSSGNFNGLNIAELIKKY